MEVSMIKIPQDFFKKIEFDKIIALLENECKGQGGIEHFRNLDFLETPDEINYSFQLVNEFHSSFELKKRIPVTTYHDIQHDIHLLSKNNFVLEAEALFRINASIRQGHVLVEFFNKSKIFPLLKEISDRVPFEPELVNLINKTLDEEGNVRPDASPELLKISRHIASKQKEIDVEFSKLLSKFSDKNLLTESGESYMNGRRVLSVPVENKRKLQGVIHDESSTGKTVFMEPQHMVKLNNDLFTFQNEYRLEINRIFRALSNDLRQYLPEIKAYQDLVIQMDIIGSKARWAQLIEAQFPTLHDKPNLHFKQAFHPLLKLKNEKEDIPTIPFELDLHGQNRILLVSGPNAGGKSILMKSVVLLQVMLQCGIPVPVDSRSKPGFFKKFIADIGDQQSIENDLSTYSSRLKIMAEALEVADQDTLLVIDEFGSGTDPKFGGALAESMLYTFNKKKCHGVVTTHYSNLKIFAYKTKGIVNGAMIFDQDQLIPTYEMRIGKPGSSYAFEIADSSGVPEKVMKYARKRTGINNTKVEDLLVSLEREKAEVEEKMENLITREAIAEKLMGNYERLHKELEVRRKKLKLRIKEEELTNAAKQNKEFENLIRELREEKKIEVAKEKAAELKAKRERIHAESTQLETALVKNKDFKIEDFTEGDYVKIGTGNQVGTINWINKGKAEVQFGNLSMVAKLNQLIPAKEPILRNQSSSVTTSLYDSEQSLTSIDIRGMSKVDAIRMIEEFLDKAVISNANRLKIIHGVGKGILRNEVFKKIKEYKDIQEYYHPEIESGGDGVTIIKM